MKQTKESENNRHSRVAYSKMHMFNKEILHGFGMYLYNLYKGYAIFNAIY
jgi:hypothetical protein